MTRPPRFTRWLVGRLVRRDDRGYVVSDLDEAFRQRLSSLGTTGARSWYRKQVLASVVPLAWFRLTVPRRYSLDPKGDPMWHELLSDLKFAARMSSRNRIATLAVIGTMVLGIGVTTAVFSVVNSVLLRPLPFDGSERVVQFGMTLRNGTATPRMAYPDMLDYARDVRSFEGVAMASLDGITVTEGDAPQQVLVARVSPDYARLFGIRPALGRFFGRDEFSPGTKVVMISTGLWQTQFGSDPSIVGRSISLGNEPHIVVGVLPPLSYTYPFRGIEILAPLFPAAGTYQANRGALWLSGVAKIRRGVSLEQSRRDVAVVADRLVKEFPDANGGLGVSIRPLQEVEVGDAREMLVLMSAAVAAVLLIACVNIATVLLGVSHSRGRELAVRSALGGSVGRIRRQLLSESLTLAAIGGLVGTALAPFATRALVALYPGDLPRAAEIGVDARVLLVAVLVTIVAGVLAGVPAARRAARLDLTRDLRDGARGTGTIAQRRTSRVLVMAQVALSVTLLFSASLLLRTFRALSITDPGFVSSDLTTFAISASRARHPGRLRVNAFYESVDRELRGLPGVLDVAMSSEVPLTTNGQLDIFVPKERGDRGKENPQVRVGTVAPGFWRTLGVPLRSGRTFVAADDSTAPRVVVVNDALAQRVYAGEDPIGRIIRWGEQDWQIVGVVGSMRMRSLAEPPQPELYAPSTQDVLRSRYVFVRSSIPAEQLIPQLRQAIGRVDPTVALTEVSSMNDRVREALAPQRFRAALTGSLGVLALALSTLGIYAVVAYGVGRQTREIGVRMALGEDAGQVRRRVVTSALRMASGGVVTGLLLAIATSRWLSTFVVGVDPRDPLMLGGAAVVLAAVAVIAAYVPARRASRIDPLVALRSD